MSETFRTDLLKLIEGYSIDAYVGTSSVSLANWVCDRIEKHKIRIENAKASNKKAIESGKIGRPKIRNDIAIRNLRARGHSLRDIAAIVGLSTAAVQRALINPHPALGSED